MKTCGELRPTQHTQGVFGEAFVADMAENACTQIGLTAVPVDDLPCQHILHQGVDGEIPTAGGGFRADEGVYKNVKVLVTLSAEGFLAGHGNVDVAALEPEDTEALPECGGLPNGMENGFQPGGGDAVDFDVNVLVFHAQQSVSDEASHKIGAAPVGMDGLGQCVCGFHIGHGRCSFFGSYFNDAYRFVESR